ncbi:GFA family protein [Aurantiacibacter sp. MUD11]|uniref:GFA family protein n=1 Tax=Aurantiacibacter sp. MUD11 TaxID=3003265 RepID=UPI0022AA943C|nr:GFA family protein [Aurantiacibacter sp. MUD11]WAT18705.1 GFA family protein [Aurantiacibacter sp. MUD11]
MTADRIEGHCLCGAVRISLDRPKHSVEICHCDMCRRWGGAFYSALSGESFTISGEDAVKVYKSSDWAERAFCGTCGSNLWYRFLPTGNRSFLAGLFSDADQYPVEKEIFTDEQAKWCDLSGKHPRQTGAEVLAEAKAAGFSFD